MSQSCYSPIHDFQPYVPASTYFIRDAREAMWRRQAEATVKKRTIKHKALDDSSTESSPKKRTKRSPTPTPINPNLSPELAQLLAQAFKTKGL